MSTLKSITKLLEMSIGIPLEDTEGPVAEAEQIVTALWPLLQSARDTIAAQNEEIKRLRAALEVNGLRAEIDETKEMLGEIEEMLEQKVTPVRVVASPSPKRERPYSPRARQVLDDAPLFLDLETTGLSKDAKIVEVAVIDAEGHVLLSTLVNPECHIPAQASAINEVYDDDVADAPTWDQIAPQIETLLSGRTVIAHNAKFEAKFLPEAWKVRWVCSKKLADRAMGKAAYSVIMHNPMRGGSLEARLYQCRLASSPLHTAAGDCVNTLRLVRYLAGDDRPVDLVY